MKQLTLKPKPGIEPWYQSSVKNFCCVLMFFIFGFQTGCSSKKSDDSANKPPENITLNSVTAEELTLFSSYTPVLQGGKSFASSGHGGPLVKSFLNDVAKAAADSGEITMPEGSVLAKAVVASDTTSPSDASRVYFMKKQKVGFDTENSNWAYFVATPVNGQFTLSSLDPLSSSCISCHKLQAEHDYARTVLIYKTQTVQ